MIPWRMKWLQFPKGFILLKFLFSYFCLSFMNFYLIHVRFFFGLIVICFQKKSLKSKLWKKNSEDKKKIPNNGYFFLWCHLMSKKIQLWSPFSYFFDNSCRDEMNDYSKSKTKNLEKLKIPNKNLGTMDIYFYVHALCMSYLEGGPHQWNKIKSLYWTMDH